MKAKEKKKDLVKKISVSLRGSTIKMLDKLSEQTTDSRSKLIQKVLDKNLKP